MNDIDKVIEYIETKGWHQGDLYGPDGSACLVGATYIIQTGTGLYDRSHVIIGRIGRAAKKLFPDRAILTTVPVENHGVLTKAPVPSFNDHPDTTLEDVMLVLKHAKEQE